MRKPSVAGGTDVPAAAKPLSGLGTLAVCGAVIVALFLGRDILVPLALALLLSFVLAPGVTWLRRWHIGRVTSVLIMVALAFLAIFSLGALIGGQINNLGRNLPQYESEIRSKIRSVQETATGSGIVERASRILHDLRDGIRKPRAEALPSGSGTTADAEPEPIPVRIQQPDPQPPGSHPEHHWTVA
jgi:predicted PurR-regulated permease PerM